MGSSLRILQDKGEIVNTMFLTPLLLLASLTTVANGLSAPECADGSISVCTCGDGNPPDFSTFPPCDIKKGKPKCECPGGGGLASKYLKPRPKRPCNPGRPACADKTPPLNLQCSGGGSPTAEAGSYPKCASGSLVCQDGSPLMCLVDGQITDTEAVFA